MIIRKAIIADLRTVRDITNTTIKRVYPLYYPDGAVDFFLNHHSEANVSRDIAAGNVFLLLNDEKLPVATITISGNEICRLFVLPEHQKRGYGRMLMEHAENLIRENHDHSVLDTSLPGKAMYLNMGYQPTEFHCVTLDNGNMLCYDVMIKRLR